MPDKKTSPLREVREASLPPGIDKFGENLFKNIFKFIINLHSLFFNVLNVFQLDSLEIIFLLDYLSLNLGRKAAIFFFSFLLGALSTLGPNLNCIFHGPIQDLSVA